MKYCDDLYTDVYGTFKYRSIKFPKFSLYSKYVYRFDFYTVY